MTDHLEVPLRRAATCNALRRIRPRLTKAFQRLLDQLIELIDDEGIVSVSELHETLFPASESKKSASAQTTKLLGAIKAASESAEVHLSHGYRGSKRGGTGQRQLFFLGLAASSMALTDGLNQMSAQPEQALIADQSARPVVIIPTICLMTFNDHERAAILNTFWPHSHGKPFQSPPRAPPTKSALSERRKRYVDDLGQHSGIRILHFYSEQGNAQSQLAAGDLIATYTLEALIAIGIAFGVNENEQCLNDVLVSSHVIPYELAKFMRGEIQPRGVPIPSSGHLFDSLDYLDRQQRDHPLATGWPTLRFGMLLSGEKLIDDITIRNSLVQQYKDCAPIGGEMEGAGIHTACKNLWRPYPIVIKAICDWGDGNKKDNKEQRQKDAAANAVSVFHHWCQSGLLTEALATLAGSVTPQAILPASANDKTSKQSRSSAHLDAYLSNCGGENPALIPDQVARTVNLQSVSNERLWEHSKLEAMGDLLSWLKQVDSPPLYALLGEYGMGKTLTCQRLYHHVFTERQNNAAALPEPWYFDLRKIAVDRPTRDRRRIDVPTYRETIAECLKWGYFGDELPSVETVLESVRGGALLIFDGLDEVVTRIGESNAQRFTDSILGLLQIHEQDLRSGSTDAALRIVLSCRTQYFRSLAEQNAHFTGDDRGPAPASRFRSVELLPFSPEQILRYLRAVCGESGGERLFGQLKIIHNLTELAARPFTLKLIADLAPSIERWHQEKRTVTGVTVYREAAQRWLIRDKAKQFFPIAVKEHLAADLAGFFAREGLRGVPADALDTWLANWLAEQPHNAGYFEYARESLQDDVRNALFLKRVDLDDGLSNRFEFAHTSLYEYFLAVYLFNALNDSKRSDEAARRDWKMRSVSRETLSFFGQLLAESIPVDSSVLVVDSSPINAMNRLNRWRLLYCAQASELQFDYAQQAFHEGMPLPRMDAMDLSGADLTDRRIGTRQEDPVPSLNQFDCRHINLSGARLQRSRWCNVNLNEAVLMDAHADQIELSHCSLHDVRWEGASHQGRRVFPAASDVPTSIDQMPYPHCVKISGHLGAVECVALSADGQRIVSGGSDGTVRLWSMSNGECEHVLEGHNCSVGSVAMSSDGQRVVSGDNDGAVRVWSAINGECERVLEGHNNRVGTVALSSDGKRVVSGGLDGMVHVWSATSGECERTFRGHGLAIISVVALSADCQRVVTGSKDRTQLYVWSVSSGECVRVLRGQIYRALNVALSADGQLVVAGSQDGTLRVWSATNDECKCMFESRGYITFALSADGQRVVTGSQDGTLRMWSTTSGESELVFRGHGMAIRSVALSADGQRVISGSQDGTLRMWSITSGECERVLGGHSMTIESVALSADGQCVVTGDNDGVVRLWSASSGECEHVLEGHGMAIRSVALSADGQRVVTGGTDRTVRLWSASSGECEHVLEGHGMAIRSVALSADGQRVISGSDDGLMRVWSASSGECECVLMALGLTIICIAMCADGQRVVSGGNDGVVRLWSATSGKCERVLGGRGQAIRSVAISADGQRVVSGGDDGKLRVWSATSDECERVLEGHGIAIRNVALSADGQRVVSGGNDGVVRLWSASSGDLLATVQTFRGYICDLGIFNLSDSILVGYYSGWSVERPDSESRNSSLSVFTIGNAMAVICEQGEGFLAGTIWRSLRYFGDDKHGQHGSWPIDKAFSREVLPWYPWNSVVEGRLSDPEALRS